MVLKLISISLGSCIGAILRYVATSMSCRYFTSSVYGTFAVNIFGCFLIGCVMGYVLNKVDDMPQVIKLFLTTGLLGSLTTFSTLNYEVFELIKSGKFLLGFGYLFVSCFIGLIFTYLGYLVLNKI